MADFSERMGVDRAKLTINDAVPVFLHFGAIFTAVDERPWLESDPWLKLQEDIRVWLQIPVCQEHFVDARVPHLDIDIPPRFGATRKIDIPLNKHSV